MNIMNRFVHQKPFQKNKKVMKKYFVIILFLCIGSLQSSAQKKDECFVVPDYLLAGIPGSVEELYFRNQYIYDLFIGCPAPEFKVVSLSGDTISLSSLRKKIVVINFWFMSCSGCIAEFPYFNRLAEEYKNKDVVFLSLCRDTNQDKVREFLLKKELKTTIACDCDQIAGRYCILGWPSTYVIGKKGRLLKSFFGGNLISKGDSLNIYNRVKEVLDDNLKGK